MDKNLKRKNLNDEENGGLGLEESDKKYVVQ